MNLFVKNVSFCVILSSPPQPHHHHRMDSSLSSSAASSVSLNSPSSSSLPTNIDTLMIDNYDSFTYNIVQYLEELGGHVTTYRNDTLTLADIYILNPKRIIISPGPGAPKDAGISMAIIKEFQGKVPIFGVCLGLQCMYEVYGGIVTYAGEIMHGKVSTMYHDQKGIFSNIPSPLSAVRYHSLAGTRETLPSCLEVTCICYPGSTSTSSSTATTTTSSSPSSSTTASSSSSTAISSSVPPPVDFNQGMIQGVRHTQYVIEGVQFHPESILTEHGHAMLKNFLTWEKATR